MAGIFDTTFLQGSSLAGESFVQAPVDSGLAQVAQTASVVTGAVATGLAGREINQAQKQFADNQALDTAITAKDTADITGNVAEANSYESFRNQASTIQAAMDSRAITASEALTRIESIKKKYKNIAPSYSRQIDGVSGRSQSSFDMATSEALRAKASFDKKVADDFSLNPNNPDHTTKVRQLMFMDTEVKELANTKEIYSTLGRSTLDAAIGMQAEVAVASVYEQIAGLGGIDALSTQQLNTFLAQTSGFTGDGARRTLDNIYRDSGIDKKLILPEVYESQVKLINGLGDALEKELKLTHPSGYTEASLKLFNDKATLAFVRAHPKLGGLMAVYNSFNLKDGYAGKALGSGINNEITNVLKPILLGDTGAANSAIEDLSRTDGKTNVTVQTQLAKTYKSGRDLVASGKATPDTIKGIASTVGNQMASVSASPKAWAPSVYIETLNHINSDGFMSEVNKIDSATAKDIDTKAADMVHQYLNSNMAVSLNNSLDGSAYVPGMRGSEARDFVTPHITAGGNLVFLANEGASTPEQTRAINDIATRLTNMYSPTVSASLATLQRVGVEAERNNPRASMVLLLGPAFKKSGAELKEEAGKTGSLPGGVGGAVRTRVDNYMVDLAEITESLTGRDLVDEEGRPVKK